MLHSNLGASSAKRWMSCPGSIRLIAQCPPQPTNKYAAEGTVAHKLAETCLNSCYTPEEYLGWFGNGETDCELYDEPTGHEFEFEITQTMCDHVRVYLNAITSKIHELKQEGHDPELFVEQSFDLSFVQEGMFGTNDASVFVPGVYLGVFDLKYGRSLVEVEDNTQLNYYACGSLHKNCANGVGGYDDLPETVETVIIQPRGKHANGPVRRWETNPQYLLGDFAKRLQDAARETQRSDAELHEGEHCYWCPAKAICPALQRRIQDEVNETFSDIDISELDEPKDVAKTKAVEAALQRSPEELSKLLKFLPVIEAWVKAINGHGQGRAENGENIPGYKLAESNGRRSYIDKKKALETYALIYEDEPEKYLKPPEPKSFTDMEKLPGMRAVVARLTKPGKKSLTLTPVNDDRPEAKVSAARDFGELDIEDEFV